MTIWQVISGIILLISGLFLVVVVLLQEPKQQGAGGVITGGVSDTYYDKNKARTKEIKLQRLTKYMAIVFFVLTLVVNLVPIFVQPGSGTQTSSGANGGGIIEENSVVQEYTDDGESEAPTSEVTSAE